MRLVVQFRQFFIGFVVGAVREPEPDPDAQESPEERTLRALLRERADSVN
jgi:hypothetical protein